MNTPILTWHGPLSDASRLRLVQKPVVGQISLAETAILMGCGIVSAVAVLLLEFKLKMPGHAILRAVLPMALGLALVPRRGAGTLMGFGAAATAAVFQFGGWGEKGLGSMTSLCLIGPCLDLAMRSAANGRRVYLSFITAGVLTNLCAMAVQAGVKGFSGGAGGGGQTLATWLPFASLTYPMCGAIAGLLSALAWFRWNSQSKPDTTESHA